MKFGKLFDRLFKKDEVKDGILMKFNVEIPVSFEEIEKYGFTPEEQLKSNPRIIKKLKECI